VTVVDENGHAVEGAQVTIAEPGMAPAQLWTDYAGSCRYTVRATGAYRSLWEKADSIRPKRAAPDEIKTAWMKTAWAKAAESGDRARADCARAGDVTASTPGIDTQRSRPEHDEYAGDREHSYPTSLTFASAAVQSRRGAGCDGQVHVPDRRRGDAGHDGWVRHRSRWAGR